MGRFKFNFDVQKEIIYYEKLVVDGDVIFGMVVDVFFKIFLYLFSILIVLLLKIV